MSRTGEPRETHERQNISPANCQEWRDMTSKDNCLKDGNNEAVVMTLLSALRGLRMIVSDMLQAISIPMASALGTILPWCM